MKAVVYTEYGSPDVLQLKEIEKPVPMENEVQIRVHATSVNYGDLIARNFNNIPPREFNMPMPLWFPSRLYFGYGKPRINILGSEFSGVVEEVGKDVKRFKPGDEVFGYLGQHMGAYAEYLCVPEGKSIAIKPANMNHHEAAVIPYGAIVALNLLRKVKLQSRQKVLIIGASGSIGSQAVQLARNHFGAEVTGVCSTRRVEFVKSLGANKVIDYTKEDFTKGDESYDLIFDILGRGSFSRSKKVLNKNGKYLLASFKTKQLMQMFWTSLSGDKKVICALSSDKIDDLVFIKELVEAGKIKAIIDKSFAFDQVAEAHKYVEDGLKKASIAITMNHNDV